MLGEVVLANVNLMKVWAVALVGAKECSSDVKFKKRVTGARLAGEGARTVNGDNVDDKERPGDQRFRRAAVVEMEVLKDVPKADGLREHGPMRPEGRRLPALWLLTGSSSDQLQGF